MIDFLKRFLITYDRVIGIFQRNNPSGRTMALGSIQPLTEMSTRCISWDKGGRCVRLTTLPLSCALVMKSGNLNFLESSGPLQASNGTALPLSVRNKRIRDHINHTVSSYKRQNTRIHSIYLTLRCHQLHFGTDFHAIAGAAYRIYFPSNRETFKEN